MSENRKKEIQPQDKIQFRIRDDVDTHILNELSIMQRKYGRKFGQIIAEMVYEQVEIERLERKQKKVTVILPSDAKAEERRALRKSEELQKIIGKFALQLYRNPSLMYGNQNQEQTAPEEAVPSEPESNERINKFASDFLDFGDD